MAEDEAGYTILYQAVMEWIAEGIAVELDTPLTICTSELEGVAAMCSEKFPSGDQNIKLNIELVRYRHVVLIFSQDGSVGVF